jgi:anti-sigma-K factor RskA
MTYSKDELLDLASGYALGTLTPDETAAVEAALPENAALAAAVQEMRETMGVMLRAEAPMVPRPGLRAEWLQRARMASTREPDAPPATRVVPLRAGVRLPTWLMTSAIAASLTGVVLLGLQLQRSRAALAVAAATIDKRDRQLNTVLEAESELLVAVLDANNAHGTGVQFFWNARQNRGIVHAFHLPPAPSGQVYQVWIQRGNTLIPVRVFNSDPDGHALVEQLALPASPVGVSAVSITIEPAGGSSRPTTTPIMTGTLLRHPPPVTPGA